MRLLLSLFIVVLSCAGPADRYVSHGAAPIPEEAISTQDFLSQVSTDEKSYKVKGVIEEVCQMKGCWMTLRNDEGANIRVTFKDYGFFVPKDISGRTVIVEGQASKEVISEDMARHYAEDGGTAYDESMRQTVSFVAQGVLVEEI